MEGAEFGAPITSSADAELHHHAGLHGGGDRFLTWPAIVEVRGLRELVAELKGPMFRDVNKDLRAFSKLIASDMLPFVEDAVRRSNAPQADAMARTVRVHSDRVPVVAVGKVNPPLKSWRGKHPDAGKNRRRRGAMAHGVLAGPKGGPNYYRIPRDNSYGPLGRALRDGSPLMRQAEDAYLRFYMATLRRRGWTVR